MSGKIRDIIDKILKSEGEGWYREENSYRGIMPEAYREFLRETDETLPHDQLSEQHIAVVYAFYEWYIGKAKTDQLPKYLQYMHADFAVNAGRSNAKRVIQWLVGTDADGVWGPRTKRAVATFFSEDREGTQERDFKDGVITYYDCARRVYYRGLASQSEKFRRYLEGWLNRCNCVLAATRECLETTDDAETA